MSEKLPPGLVAIPATDMMWTKSVLALLGIIQGLPPYSSIDINPQISSPAANRNFLVERFLSVPHFQWLLLLDADMTPRPETVARLLSHNVDIVGATCYQRSGEYLPCWNELTDKQPNENGLLEVASVGTGCLLVSRRALRAMSQPYFPLTPFGSGEDVAFCVRARELGFPVYLDTQLVVGHMHVLPVDEQNVSLLVQQPRVEQLRSMRANVEEAGVATR